MVDRLDLLTQASIEFTNRGLKTVNCESKADFSKELNPLSTDVGSKAIGEICVVNIQKFEGKMPEAKNDYHARVQRIFFVDEAHKSYSSTGEFFKNLMTCDMDAIYIALTGTPLLSKKERSNLKFVKPPEEVLKSFDNYVQAFYKQIEKNKIENQELTSLRDFLLPLLMNGQVGFKIDCREKRIHMNREQIYVE